MNENILSKNKFIVFIFNLVAWAQWNGCVKTADYKNWY